MALQNSMLPLCKRNSSADTFPSYFCPTTAAGPRRRHRDPRPLWERACELRPNKRADERTRTAYPCSLRVITQPLQGCAGSCKCRVFRRLFLLQVAACCTVLRCRWYQIGIRMCDSYSLTVGPMACRRTLRHHSSGRGGQVVEDALFGVCMP
jgi:hypothetical protein